MIPSNPINLIMSGAYISNELIAEFGPLPPAFLPLGVGRLYDKQISCLKQDTKEVIPIYITLPESFEIPCHDLQYLKEKGVTPIFIPDGLELGEAIVLAINSISAYSSSIRILHGDTVLNRLPNGLDVAAAHPEKDDYCWAAINHTNNQIDNFELIEAATERNLDRSVACGYFAFSSCSELVRSMVRSRYDFIKGLNLYNKRYPMRMEHVEDWYDFGHLQTYYHSRRMVSTSRSFNSLQITDTDVRKYSTDHFKMEAEAHWFANLPPLLLPYSARLLDKGIEGNRTFYATEYQYTPNLSELFVFSEIGKVTWKKILNSSISFLENCNKYKGNKTRDHYMNLLMGSKTISRLERYSEETGFNIERPLQFNGSNTPSLLNIAETLQTMISENSEEFSTIMHGDFHFGNILYNSRNSRISVIDPRGYVSDKDLDIYGDIRYDIAKYSHSINGLYDLIIAGRYSLTQDHDYSFFIEFEKSQQRDWLQKIFSELIIANIAANSLEIQAITISLFLSMLPLHADRPDRQAAFIANALRLFSNLESTHK
ncbi:ecdysteroid kinase [Zymomonas mobilis]|uniref:capsular polysaccharide biosynthesis protein n=1 Tax=Zymomonas mobilis TaxID=542 RepID=UPI00026D833D|nr:capsular polysaccharide biosynthesis protein [Zymomonas mobilis]AFN55957.1 capsular polysaccharide biosynthesis protein [Zymomonas mobilis subsp. mobilis ATCC 29191]TQK78612.1 ecdysteroid kinase [Zymomonas mobilis]TQL16183.1 ecdysteroid kinase [Zymomonas mobilis]GEB86993.1 hypothetical protein ZMO01_03330 [Zymomonas mobilis subsp. mobilis]